MQKRLGGKGKQRVNYQEMKKRALMLAPHPDDECITGLLPLRLQEECGFEVWVVPVTLGSRKDRRAARARELRAACRELGFRLRLPMAVSAGIARVGELTKRLKQIQPAVVFLPHARDGHPTHRAVHGLGVAAMDAAGGTFSVVETDYWHPLENPNLMVAAAGPQLEKLCRGLACHKGELARNDYAARLPAWMMDNVRRGAEKIFGSDVPVPDIAYATLYRARRRKNKKWQRTLNHGQVIESSAELGALAERWSTSS